MSVDFYELYEDKITGENYKRYPYGHAPEHFKNPVKELEQEGKITENIRRFDHDAYPYRYSSLKKPELELLSNKRIHIGESFYIITKLDEMSIKRLSEELVHK